MKGFSISPLYKSLVAQTLPNAAPERDVDYYRISTALPGGIQSFEDKTRATRGNFYSNGGDTRLQTAIDSAKSNQMTILVTDLFQTSADMNAVSRSLTDFTLENETAIGLFAVRLPFKGRVFDLGFDGRSFTHDGERPLYGLVLGSPVQISEYFDNMRRFLSSPNYRYLLFGTQISRKSYEVGKIVSRDNLVQVSPNAAPRIPEDRRLSVRISNNNREAGLTVALEPHLLNDAKPLVRDGKKRASTTEVWRLNEGKSEYVNISGKSASGSEAVSASVVPGENQQNLEIQIQPQELTRGHYCFNLELVLEEWGHPDWISEWSLPASQFQAENPDGSKTANLKPFLLDLNLNLLASAPPKLGAFQIYVQKTR